MEKMDKILIIGASSDLAQQLNEEYIKAGVKVGLHYGHNVSRLQKYAECDNALLLPQVFDHEHVEIQAKELVEKFVAWAGGIDALVILIGDIKQVINWREVHIEQWYSDIDMNAMVPFFIARTVATHMEEQKNGRIIFTSTSSAVHGGGSATVTYGASKALLESIMKRMAKDLAASNILVNAIAPGVIETQFHTKRMGRTLEQMQGRMKSIPLKRMGNVTEFTSLVRYLLSPDATFMTGQVLNLDGGDFI